MLNQVFEFAVVEPPGHGEVTGPAIAPVVGKPAVRPAVLLVNGDRHDPRLVDKGVLDAVTMMRIEVEKHMEGKGDIDLSDLAGAVFDMKKQLLEGIEAQKAMGVAYENEAAILENADALQGRVEALKPREPFDTIISRAFASLPRMLALTSHLRHQDARILAMKGKLPVVEIDELPKGYRLETYVLRLPFSDDERHLLIIRDNQNTADGNA